MDQQSPRYNLYFINVICDTGDSWYIPPAPYFNAFETLGTFFQLNIHMLISQKKVLSDLIG